MSNLVETKLGPNWLRVCLQNPPHNGLNTDLTDQLSQVLSAAGSNPEIRAILLEAAGNSFCVGADLKWASQQPINALSKLVRGLNRVCELVLTIPKPVIVAVNGPAAGGGLALALCGDVRLASDRASFKLAYPSIGISLDGGSSFRLSQLIGMTRAQELIYQDRGLSAAQAQQLGLVHEVRAADRLEEAACERLQGLAGAATVALGETKRLLNPPEQVRERLDKEAEAIDRIVKTQDTRNAMQAFLQKRTPVFEGK